MNIETANRLYQYRKKMGLSQEELAARIGVSRQAVSKWERAEASPDTDNLIELANVYGLTLDELLMGKEDAPESEQTADDTQAHAQEEADTEENTSDEDGFTVSDDGDTVRIGRGGIHITDRDGTRVDIDRKGIFVNENGEQKVYTDEDGHIHKSADIEAQEHKHKHSFWLTIPYPIITVIAYMLFGYFNVCGGWGYGWIVFLTIPIYYTLIEAIQKRDANIFCYPIFAVIAFLIMGFVWGLWHPGWVVFLTIPAYYGVINGFKNRR